ncbi:MAG: iron-sulfur cluster-binding domain-containing protein [Myxococcales bacterium]|nr:iron-sulfur cluster-binding domain-containing protein [Myxococcales bacterium]
MNTMIVVPAAIAAVAGVGWLLFRSRSAPAPARRDEPEAAQWKVTKVTRETPSTVSLEFDASLEFRAGQFVLVRPTRELPWRAYSFSRAPGQPLRLTIKRVEGGAVSTFVTEKLSEGAEIEVKGPFGQFVLPDGAKSVLMLAGGSGVTPMIAFLHDLAKQGWPAKVTLVDANRSANEQILRKEIDELVAASGGKLTVVHVLDDASGEGSDKRGPMTRDVVASVLEGMEAPEVVALCGPAGMMESCNAVVRERFPSAKLLEEKFTAVVASVGADAIAHEVELVDGAKTKTFTVREGESVLHAARRAKVELAAGCESGVCGTCRVKMRRGQIDTPDESCLTAEERSQGYALVCIGTAKAPCSIEPAP